jgi:hypothetical protein
MHVPPEHAAKPPVTAVQPASQAPQWADAVDTSTQRSVHKTSLPAQAALQPFAVQSGVPFPQATPHAVHDAGLDRSASHPSLGSPLQSAQPGSQVPIPHAPASVQPTCACGSGAQGVQLVEPQPKKTDVAETQSEG